AHGGLRADGTVPAGHDVRGRAGAVQRMLVLVLRNRGLPGGRRGLGSEAQLERPLAGKPTNGLPVLVAATPQGDPLSSCTYSGTRARASRGSHRARRDAKRLSLGP